MNFYDLLGVSVDATAAEIQEAYQNKVAELYVLKSTGALDNDIFDTQLNNLVKANSVLSDDKVRAEYDEYIANGRSNSRDNNGSSRAGRRPAKDKKGIMKKVATGAVCVAVAVSVLATGIFGAKKIGEFLDNRNNSKVDTTQSQIDSSYTPTDNDNYNVDTRASNIVQKLNAAGLVNEETSQPYTINEVKDVIEYIDGSYTPDETTNIDELVMLNGKANNIAQQLKSAGLVNVETNQPYTTDEIKDVIQYIDGVYELEGTEAVNVVYDFLNVVSKPLSNQQINNQDVNDTEYNQVKEYGDIMDDNLVQQRATALVNELNTLKVINPVTCVPYTVDECFALIKYANGVYVPATMEEIDVLHLNLLNLLISPLNTDQYLYHVVYASGNDDFKDLAEEAVDNVTPVNFAGAFAEYGENGVYPLTQWMQEKREEIYTTTDREEINKIYIEVGQVMADIMKGNGCTITVMENGKERTYTFTSEQILANHASAMLLTIDAQLIFANHYEIRDENDKVIDSTQTVWQVYNKFNGEEPDQVSLDEIQAWINNGCDYEWGIEDVLIGGQTFGQRIQGDMEGMAQNNYAMHSGQSLTK